MAATLPLPTALAGTSIRVRDGAGVERFAPLFFASPSQVNYQIPPGTANGPATVIVSDGQGNVASGSALIEATSPGLFSANADGQGVAAAVVLRRKADGSEIYEPVAVFDNAQKKVIARPGEFGAASDQLFLILFGSRARGRAAGSSVVAQIGGEQVEVLYAGAQGGLTGLDQFNLTLPRSLEGRGEVAVAVTIDGKAANVVRVAFAGARCDYRLTPTTQSVSSSGGDLTI